MNKFFLLFIFLFLVEEKATSVISSSSVTFEATLSITEIITNIKRIQAYFTGEHLFTSLKHLDANFLALQDLIDAHITKIDDMIEETENELKIATNETSNENFLMLFRKFLRLFEFTPPLLGERVSLNIVSVTCGSLLLRMKRYEEFLTRMTHLRQSVTLHVNIFNILLVDVRAVMMLDSEELTPNFEKIFKNFVALRKEGEGLEVEVTVAIGLLQSWVEMDNEVLRIANCTETLPCGTFLRYDPVVDPKAPRRNGFSAGKYEDNSEAYIGKGYTTNCHNSHLYYLAPGRINIDLTTPGLFVESYGEMFVNKSVKYLLDSPHLRWENFTWTPNCKIPENAVVVKNPDISYGIGRYVKDDVTHVGKVMSFWGFFYAYKGSPVNQTQLEILICDEN